MLGAVWAMCDVRQGWRATESATEWHIETDARARREEGEEQPFHQEGAFSVSVLDTSQCCLADKKRILFPASVHAAHMVQTPLIMYIGKQHCLAHGT